AHAAGMPTRILIPSIRVDSPVVPVGWTTTIQDSQLVSEWETADFAVGFHKSMALPGGTGNTVMSGHNNIQGAVFRYLDQIKVGDKITVYTAQKTFVYTVAQTMIVEEKFASREQQAKNAAWIAPTNDNRLTLVSCWPYNNNTHRVIIVAKPSP
ncbi:MAG: sortase, partial [Chloroflexi bacterium]|nr:sortase [Chloroflexota bacterium]